MIYTITDEDFELPTPTRNGYEFVGWTGEGITTPQTSVIIPKGSTGDKAYTANWQVIEYTITLDTNGGPNVSPIKYTVEDSFTLPYPLRPGYEFAGWTPDGSGMLPATTLIIYYGTTGDLHYKAEWRLAEYTITMDLNGGSGQEKVVYTITDEDFELPTPTRNGYEFVGWTGERITTPQTSVKIPKGSTGNKAYTANWKVIRYTITLVTNGGAVIASIRYTVEDSVTLPIPPERPGYEFAGWVLDGSGQFPSTPMIIPEGSTGDRIYEAEWRVATYTITYVSHGRVYNWVQYTINNQIYFGAPEEDPSYYLPGYTFVGWKIDGVEGTPRSYMLPKGSYGNRTATMLSGANSVSVNKENKEGMRIGLPQRKGNSGAVGRFHPHGELLPEYRADSGGDPEIGRVADSGEYAASGGSAQERAARAGKNPPADGKVLYAADFPPVRQRLPKSPADHERRGGTRHRPRPAPLFPR